MQLSGWGRYPRAECKIQSPRSISEVRAALKGEPVIARGMGRAYGDSSLNQGATLDMTRLNRMLAFDPETGLLAVEAGVVLGDIVDSFLPRGWFPPVTPGTKFVTVGGMIAADVHGKNHHKHGSFGNFVEWIDIIGPSGKIIRCSQKENSEIFAYTVGGMGLTGVIVRVAFRLRPVETAWIHQEMLPAPNLEAVMARFDTAEDCTYSVAWIDCLAAGERLGRSLLMLGEHARHDELDNTKAQQPFSVLRKRKIRIPIDAPSWALNKWTVRAFNALYYSKGVRAAGRSLVDWDSFFYPLDGFLEWNRIYGRRGFTQYQCVIPLESSAAGLTALLKTISASGQGSFLAVLKRLGHQERKFSFPMQGYTLALDFPVCQKTLALLERLDQITLHYGGRLYLAKDARMTRDTLEKSDSRVEAFREMRKEKGATSHFSSLQSERLSI